MWIFSGYPPNPPFGVGMSPTPSSLNHILRGESTTGILHTILGDPTFSTILWLRQFAWCRDDTVGSEINAWDKPPFDLKKWGGWICSSDFISVMPCRLQFQMIFRCAVFSCGYSWFSLRVYMSMSCLSCLSV